VNRERKIFDEALDIASPEERAGFLRGACRDDPELLAEIEALLRDHGEAIEFFPERSQETVEAMPLAEGAGSTIGRYKLLEKIGEGGFGVVYMADQTEPVKRRVALKIIKLGMDTKQVIGRFEAERQALAMLDHPNIAKVLDAGSTDTGRPYFVMDLVRGVSIIEFCDEHQLSVGDRLDLFTEVCAAIHHAHQKGIIHRDLKPSNILVTLHDDKAVPKVIDFGIAKATQAELTEVTLFTRFQEFLGTPAYMSPEQAQMSGLDIDTRSDIYSLGVLLYQILTGSTPFDAKELLSVSFDDMRKRIREEEPPRPSTRLRQLTGDSRTLLAERELRSELDWIVMRAMEKDRTRRYDSANALAADVRRHLRGEAVEACPPSIRYRFGKFARRHRYPLAGIGMVVVALALGLGLTTWQAIRASQATGRANVSKAEALTQAALAEEKGKRQRLIAYASDMRAAQIAIGENNLGLANTLLRRYIPEDNEDEDLRGVEWHYLWGENRGDSATTLDHESIVRRARFRRTVHGWRPPLLIAR